MKTGFWLNGLLVALAIASVAGACSGSNGDPAPGPSVTTKSVSISGGTSPLAMGASTQLSATATMSDNSQQSVTSSSTWSSSSPGVASVSSSGLVQALTAGTTNITATSQAVTSAPFGLTVKVVIASFTVTPDAGLGFNVGQCPLNDNVNGSNKFLCTLDATASAPSASITSYAWEVPEGGKTFSGSKVNSGFTIPCSTFNGGGVRKVKLTVKTAAGSDSISNDVTFVKATPC